MAVRLRFAAHPCDYHQVMTPAKQGARGQHAAANGKRPEGTSIPIADSGALTRPLKTAEMVARNVVRDILAESLEPGDSLISEAAMLEKYGVSRESLREGLRLLEAQGLISIRRGPGGGPIVGTVDPGSLGRISTLFYQLAGATYRELFEAWVITETMSAERAARNRDQLLRTQVMRPYLIDHEGMEPSDVDLESFVVAHSDFHSAVASLSGNRVLQLAFQTAGRIVAHHVAVTGDPRILREVLEADHHAIAYAVAAGHARQAASLMESHIVHVRSLYEESMGDQLADYIEWH